jgi:hypothetical protein
MSKNIIIVLKPRSLIDKTFFPATQISVELVWLALNLRGFSVINGQRVQKYTQIRREQVWKICSIQSGAYIPILLFLLYIRLHFNYLLNDALSGSEYMASNGSKLFFISTPLIPYFYSVKVFIFPLWIYAQSTGLGRVIGPLQDLNLDTRQHKHRTNAHTMHLCFE